MIPFAASPARVARRKQAEMSTEASKALMKWLGKTLGSKAKHVYVVGGAVRNFKLDQPIKDIDMVVDSINLGHDAAWVAQQLARKIPAPTNIAGPDNLRVTKVNVTGTWVLDGFDLNGETLDIVDARKEEYEVDPATGEYVGHKPTKVEPTTMEVDVSRREFTFNTLMWRLSDLAKGVDQAEIIDMTGCGLRDLENREMRCPMDPDEVFALDPTRIIRTIKFAFKYGMKLPPDVKAAAKRQAKGLKRIPAKAYGAIKDIALESPDYKKALDVMADLGVTDVIAEIMKSDKQFRNSLLNYAEKKGVSYLFDLMDVGIPVSAPMSFLSRPQQARLREIAALMDREDAMAFLGALRNPGKAYQDGRFIPSLAQEKGIERNQMGKFMPAVNAAAREALLAEPTLLENPSALKGVVRSRVIKASRKATTDLGVLLETMEIPDMRRDLSSKSNLRWLLRNLRVNNGSHPQIDEAMAEIKALVRGKRADLTARWGTTLLAGGDKIPGGRAEGKSPSDFDPKQIEMGTGVEMEHTTDRAVAREVAMDHLTEIPDYYSRLDKMEGEAGVKHAWVQRLQMKREAAAQLRFAWADDRG